MSGYLSTGTSLHVCELSNEDGLLKRAIDNPIVHGKSLYANQTPPAALPISREHHKPFINTALQNKCELPAIHFLISDCSSLAEVSAVIPAVFDHSYNVRTLAYAQNDWSLGEQYELPYIPETSNTSMRASLVVTLAAPSRYCLYRHLSHLSLRLHS